MSAVCVNIAEAVRAALAAGHWSQSFTPVRAYSPQYSLEELKTLRVVVLPASLSVAPLDRAENTEMHECHVSIQKHLASDANSVMDPMLALAEELAAAFQGKRLATYNAARCASAAVEPLWSPERLGEDRVFVTVVKLTFGVYR